MLATLGLRRAPVARDTPLSIAVDLLAPSFVPLPLGLALAGLTRDARMLAALAFPAGAFVALYGRRFMPRRHAAETPWSVRLLTANLLMHGDNADVVAKQVLAAAPDILATQELQPHVAARLCQLLGARYPHQVLVPEARSHGLGWWSRLPLLDLGTVRGAEGQPLALAVEARGPAGPLRFVTVHPFVPFLGPRAVGPRLYDGRRRGRELAAIATFMRDLPRPLVTTGDFNLTEHSDTYARVRGDLRDAFAEVGRGFGHTFPTHITLRHAPVPWPWPFLRLDYCFVSQDLQPLEATLLGRNGSDHLPLLVRFGPAGRC